VKALLGIQVRSKSARLPNKYLQKIGDKTLMQWVWQAAANVKCMPKVIDHIPMVLMPHGDKDLQEYCQKEGMEWFAPDVPEDNLLSRYVYAAKEFSADIIIRVTGDCWMLQTSLIELCIQDLMSVDYCSNTVFRSYVEGVDVQGCGKNALLWFHENAENREHPFLEFDLNDNVRKSFVGAGFTWKQLINRDNQIFSKTSIDTEEDVVRARQLYEHQRKSTGQTT